MCLLYAISCHNLAFLNFHSRYLTPFIPLCSSHLQYDLRICMSLFPTLYLLSILKTITVDGLQSLTTNFKSLRGFYLSGCEELCLEGLVGFLSKSCKLLEIDLTGSNLDQAEVRRRFPSLKYIVY